jgi:hypothetical protein
MVSKALADFRRLDKEGVRFGGVSLEEGTNRREVDQVAGLDALARMGLEDSLGPRHPAVAAGRLAAFGVIAEESSREGEAFQVFGAKRGIARRGIQLPEGAGPGLSVERFSAALEGGRGLRVVRQ